VTQAEYIEIQFLDDVIVEIKFKERFSKQQSTYAQAGSTSSPSGSSTLTNRGNSSSSFGNGGQGSSSNSGGGGGNQSKSSSSSNPGSFAPQQDENILSGDLARLLGIHGKTVNIGGSDILLIYVIVIGILGVSFLTGHMEILRYCVFGLFVYMMYTTYMKSRGGTGGDLSSLGGGGMVGGGGPFGGGGGPFGGGGGQAGQGDQNDESSKFGNSDSRAGGGAYRR